MTTALLAFALSAVAGVLLTPAVRDWAIRRGVLDQALTSRKIHAQPVPRLGGMSIVVAFYLPVVVLLLVDPAARTGASARTMGLLAGGLVVALLGLVDDLKGLRAGPKLAGQVAAAGVAYALGLRIDAIASPFGPDIALGALGLPFTVFWFVGAINAMNLIDGIDGLAGGVGFIAITGTFVLSALHADAPTMLVAAALAGASLGFLIYNFSPASVFMGDTGSMFLGFVLAATAIPAHQRSAASVEMIAPIVALGLPIGDTLLAIVRRGLRGRSPLQADREHIHHLLLSRGWSQRRACLALYGVTAALAAAAVWLDHARDAWAAAFVIGATVLGAAALLRWAGRALSERVPEGRAGIGRSTGIVVGRARSRAAGALERIPASERPADPAEAPAMVGWASAATDDQRELVIDLRRGA